MGEERQKDRELVDEQEKLVVTWAEEVDEAEEKGVNVFAPEMSLLPHTASVTSASPENEATGAAATQRLPEAQGPPLGTPCCSKSFARSLSRK